LNGLLENRSIITIEGEDAEHFLENLVTCKIAGMEEGEGNFGALLTPQGKIMFDFFVIRQKDGYLIDIESELAPEFLKRMTFYKLRAKVKMEAQHAMQAVTFTDELPKKTILSIKDPRHHDMPKRAYGSFGDIAEADDYLQYRIRLGVPEGGHDFQYGNAFPHEILMDKNNGIDFRKGCYVGQEVVSRMQHRATVRKRVIKVSAETNLPPTGTPVLADDKPSGNIGSTDGKNGLALIRLDRASAAKHITANGVELTCKRPEWLDIEWPVET